MSNEAPTDALRLVPVELTRGMMDAANRVDWTNEDERATIINIWQAMLAAAPASPLPGGGHELTSAREVFDLIERNPVLIGLKGKVSDSLLIETGYAMVDFLKSLPAAPTGEQK